MRLFLAMLRNFTMVIPFFTSHSICHSQIRRYENSIKQAPLIIFDANLTIDTMSLILDMCRKYNKPGKSSNTKFLYFIYELIGYHD